MRDVNIVNSHAAPERESKTIKQKCLGYSPGHSEASEDERIK